MNNAPPYALLMYGSRKNPSIGGWQAAADYFNLVRSSLSTPNLGTDIEEIGVENEI